MARDSLLGGNFFQGLAEARGQDMRREREERERLYRRRNPSFGDMLKQNLKVQAASAVMTPVGEALGGAITSIIQTPFQRNVEEFEELENVVRMRNEIKRSQKSRGVFQKIEDAITSSGQTEDEYFKNNTAEQIAQDMNKNYAEFKSVPLAQAVNERSRELANEVVEYTDPKTQEKISLPRWQLRQRLYNNARKEFMEVPGGTAEFDASISRANKRASNAAEAALKGFGRLFSGKSKEDLDMEAIKSLKNSKLYRENEEFQSAYQLYLGSGNVENLQEIASNILESDELSTKQTVTSYKTSTDPETGATQLIEIKTESVTDIYGNVKQGPAKNYDPNNPKVITIPDTGYWGKNLETIQKVSQASLNPKGIAELQRWAKDNEIDIYKPKTSAQYTAAMEEITRLSQDGNYKSKLSPEKLIIFRSAADAIHKEMVEVEARIYSLKQGLEESDDKAYYEKELERARRKQAGLALQLAEASEDLKRGVVPTIEGNFNNSVDWEQEAKEAVDAFLSRSQ